MLREILFSEAARKGVPGVDYARALAACVRNAERPSPDPRRFGRYLEDYEELGYLSTRVLKGCVSRHIEYTYQDWCIARLADQLGDRDTAARFQAKSARLWNLWRADRKVFWPRRPDGSWAEHSGPDDLIPDSWNDPYAYESSLRHWSFNALHDIEGLILRHGGRDAFLQCLDTYFQEHGDIEKETRMHIPHLYAFAGRADRTAQHVRWSLENRYADTADGIPDDEDMGCHSAFYICNALGLYPLYGQTLYSIVPAPLPRGNTPLWTNGKVAAIAT
ncbi:MAG: glycoside hydrolase domain-containing protein [Verrucomicrobiota bacterium]